MPPRRPDHTDVTVDAKRAAIPGIHLHRAALTPADFDHPRPRTNVHVHGREVDAWWPRAGLAVELDGWQDHGTRRAFERDRAKGNWLALHGVTLLRFTHRDVHDRAAATAAQAHGGAGPRCRP